MAPRPRGDPPALPGVGPFPDKDITTKGRGDPQDRDYGGRCAHDLKVYPGTKHAFFNDTLPDTTPTRRPTPGGACSPSSAITEAKVRRDLEAGRSDPIRANPVGIGE